MDPYTHSFSQNCNPSLNQQNVQISMDINNQVHNQTNFSHQSILNNFLGFLPQNPHQLCNGQVDSQNQRKKILAERNPNPFLRSLPHLINICNSNRGQQLTKQILIRNILYFLQNQLNQTYDNYNKIIASRKELWDKSQQIDKQATNLQKKAQHLTNLASQLREQANQLNTIQRHFSIQRIYLQHQIEMLRSKQQSQLKKQVNLRNT